MNGKELKVRVEEDPQKQNKRQAFWKAVDALKSRAKEEEDYILDAINFVIYDAKDVERLGSVMDGIFQWNEDRVKQCLPNVELLALKRATVERRRQM